MPIFEPYVQNILLEITGSSSRKSYRSGKIKKRTSPGGGGFGGGAYPTPTGPYNMPWQGTPETPGTLMPPGSAIYGQGQWGAISKAADSVLDTYTQLIPEPVTKFLIKQQVKGELAKEYLRGSGDRSGYSISSPSAFTSLKDKIGSYFTQVKDKPGEYEFKSPVESSDKRGGKSQFGVLGDKVYDKIPDLMAMGIDPLDWTTKAFGAQSAIDQITNIGSQTANAALGAGGYLERGKRKGIF